MIYTLEYLQREADAIVRSWNGSDERFTDSNGDTRTEDDVRLAEELMERIDEIDEIIKALNI